MTAFICASFTRMTSVTLDKRYARDARVKVQAMDGYRALPGLVPPREKRGLVMIDPPFEHRDEMAFMAQAAKSALERWPTGTFIFWRPLKDLWAQERFDVGLAEWLIADQGLEGEKLLRADMWVRELKRRRAARRRWRRGGQSALQARRALAETLALADRASGAG
jgi:23S rRNA A2030 N6-methylase RlmJ